MALMLFPIFTFVQWLLTGIIVGIVLQLKHHRKRAFDKILTSANDLNCSTLGSNRSSGYMPMKYESKLLYIVILLETGVVVLAYFFAWSFFSLISPTPLWSEVLKEKGLLFLILPAVTGMGGAILLAKAKERYLFSAILVLAAIAITVFIVLVDVRGLTEGPGM